MEWLPWQMKVSMQAASIPPDPSSLLFSIQAAQELRLAISLKYVDECDIRSNGRFLGAVVDGLALIGHGASLTGRLLIGGPNRIVQRASLTIVTIVRFN